KVQLKQLRATSKISAKDVAVLPRLALREGEALKARRAGTLSARSSKTPVAHGSGSPYVYRLAKMLVNFSHHGVQEFQTELQEVTRVDLSVRVVIEDCQVSRLRAQELDPEQQEVGRIDLAATVRIAEEAEDARRR